MDEENYVIVGGSHGIGLETVRRLSEAGKRVFVLSRTQAQLDLANVTHIPFDAVQDNLDTDLLPDQINGLAYCPGTIQLKSFRGLSPDQFREDFEVNVIGAIKVIQATTNALKKASNTGTSSVVLFSTVAVQQGLPLHASVAASKGAIEGLTRTLAAELSPKVRVNCIAPALTQTKLTEKFFADDTKAAALAERYPLKRTGTVADIAAMCCFLLTAQSDWMTGQVLGLDGGMSTIRK